MNHLPTLPLLEALRPPPGWRTDRAILSAYSAEPRVLVSLLLALAGRDDDSGSGSRVALARTLDELRGRVAFVLQRGRIAAPNAAPRVLALLDRFVREAPWDEGGPAGASGRSWHAKLALVRLVASDDGAAPPQWRFWLGSRNFTLDTSWDIALSLETVQPGSSGGQTLEGIEQVAARLAEHADETARWQPHLRTCADPMERAAGADAEKNCPDASRGHRPRPPPVSAQGPPASRRRALCRWRNGSPPALLDRPDAHAPFDRSGAWTIEHSAGQATEGIRAARAARNTRGKRSAT